MRFRPEHVLLPLLAAVAVAAAGAPGAQRAAALEELLRHDCGSCHGLTLEGGLGPPLVPEAMRARPPAALLETILDGRPGTAMPPWRPLLSVEEAQWLVERLQKGAWP